MIIGLTGPAGVGKRFVAERIQTLSHADVKIIAFTDPLKDSLCQFLNITRETLEIMKRSDDPFITVHSPEGPESLSVREALERYGDEAHRQVFGENFWVEQAERRLVETDHEVHVVFDDVRYANEIDMVHRHGGLIWEVIDESHQYGDHHASRKRIDLGSIAFQVVNDRSQSPEAFDNLIGSMLAAHDSLASALGEMLAVRG